MTGMKLAFGISLAVTSLIAAVVLLVIVTSSKIQNMLKKQSIRANHKIYLNKSKEVADKSEIIALSEFWNENEEFLFKKLLKQGGSAKIQNNHFRVVVREKMLKLNEMQRLPIRLIIPGKL